MEWKIEVNERNERKRNIINKEMEIRTEREILLEKVEKLFEEKLNIDIKTEWTRHIGKKKMIQVRLRSWREKEEIMKKESMLRENKIFIDYDRTKKEREIQKRIVEFGKRKKEGRKKVTVKYKKLLIDDTWYGTWYGRERTKTAEDKKV